MDAWIPITLAATAAQTLRFLVQRHLKVTRLSTGGATFSRFLFSAPLVLVGIIVYGALSGTPLPRPSGAFWGYALPGGLAQILATMCVVQLFMLRNFAVGITLKKTETVQTAFLSLILLGEAVSAGGAVAIGMGFLGVLALSKSPEEGGGISRHALMLGLLSGALFAVSATCYRGAALSLGDGDVILRAGVTLAAVTLFQSVALGAWLAVREPGQLAAVAAAWRLAALAGIASMIGSYCWFMAFALQNAAYVKALGQVELVFSVLASTLFLGEKISPREMVGIGLLTGSVVLLVLLV